MFRHLRSHAVAYLAIFVALGGTSYAAVKVAKNSVATKQLKSNAVNSAKVKNGSLLAAEFGSAQVPKGARGAKGDTGDQGAVGIAGIDGGKGEKGLPGDPAGNAGQLLSLNEGDAVTQRAPVGPPDPDHIVKDVPFTTTATKTTLIVSGYADVTIDAQQNSSANEIGAFVDGVGVPGTKDTTFSGLVVPFTITDFPARLQVNGVITDIAPGAHHLQFGFKSAGGIEVTYVGGSAHVLNVSQ